MAQLKPYDEGYALEYNYDLQKILRENRYKYVVGGHTHYRMFRRINNIIFINAGSLKQNDYSCFLTIDFNKEIVQFYHIDFEELISEGESFSLLD